MRAREFFIKLHPAKQAWVHVDYARYRKAYQLFDLEPLEEGDVLDHIQNRRAVRIRGYSHPYLRICPISRTVNTNAGGRHGMEGMERRYISSVGELSEEWQAEIERMLAHPLQFADPADLTKMLNFSPGTHILDGVRELQSLFYS